MSEVIDRSTLKALSTDTRQEILKMLTKRPYTASEMSRILNKHVTTITEHLGVLEKSGVVRKKESTNKWVYYILTDKGEKFFKPYYTFVVILSLSVIAIIFGFVQIFFVSYQSATMSVGETLQVPQAAGAAKIAQTAVTVQTYDTNLIIGAIAIILGAVLLIYAVQKKNRHEREKLKMTHHIMNY